MKGPSPLVGYNTNVRHKGKVYHIQTEDSGLSRPHLITHLFADGGRIVSSRKTDYAAHVGRDDYAVVVKKMMQEQHKAMFIALHEGEFDAELGETTGTVAAPGNITTAKGETPSPLAAERRSLDTEALEQAAAAAAADAGGTMTAGKYQATRPAKSRPSSPPRAGAQTQSESIFGGDVLSEKSLDEVILSYLAEDLDEDEL
ncbi:MAG: hypothetical protein IPK60_15885 [Sandaracinaceae bacterium]|nr:hypothetical protein [Sandaracinaceae bacterium]